MDLAINCPDLSLNLINNNFFILAKMNLIQVILIFSALFSTAFSVDMIFHYPGNNWNVLHNEGPENLGECCIPEPGSIVHFESPSEGKTTMKITSGNWSSGCNSYSLSSDSLLSMPYNVFTIRSLPRKEYHYDYY